MLSRKSVTLIELMISVAVLSIILSLVFSITGTGKVSWYISSAKISLNRQARATISKLSNELMLSSPSRVFILSEDSLKFSVPLVDSNGDLMLNNNGDLRWGDGEIEGNSINYITEGTNLIRQILNANDSVVSGTKQIISHNLESLLIELDQLQYEITLNFMLAEYLGKRFSDPILYSVTTALTPQN